MQKVYKIYLALKDTKIVYTGRKIIVGYNIKTGKLDFYTISRMRLVYFDTADTKEQARFKLQILLK